VPTSVPLTPLPRRSKRTDPDEAFTRERMRIFLTPNEGKTFAYGAFEREAPDRLVGLTGCHQSEPVPECGYMFFPEYWGKGYATEALRAWLAAYWALERREAAMVEEDKERGDGVEVLMATTDVTNVGSQGVLRKCGFVETKRFDMEGTVPFIEFVLPRPT